MNYQLLQSLLQHLEAYDRQGLAAPDPADAAGQLAAFATWLGERLAPGPPPAAARPPKRPDMPQDSDEVRIGIYNTILYRYVRLYTRLALEDSLLVTFDDFVYLTVALGYGPLSKTELIQRNIHDKGTGIEIIKRLLVRELLREEANPNDRRSKLIHLTDAGRTLLFQLYPRMNQVAQMAAGNLTADERHQLVRLLLKLDQFHNPIFLAPRPASFEELAAQFFPHLPADPAGAPA